MNRIVEQSPFRAAFLNMKIKPTQHQTHGKLIDTTIGLLAKDAGTRKVPEWNAHLKHKTYQALVAQKVMA
jgi:hypothetical protein